MDLNTNLNSFGDVLAVGFKLVFPIKNLLAFDFLQFPVYAVKSKIMFCVHPLKCEL